jgi:hypothetical protein
LRRAVQAWDLPVWAEETPLEMRMAPPVPKCDDIVTFLIPKRSHDFEPRKRNSMLETFGASV